jgi:hypothetical protein
MLCLHFVDSAARVRGKTTKNITLKEREEAGNVNLPGGEGGGGGREEKKDNRSQSSTPTRRGDLPLLLSLQQWGI